MSWSNNVILVLVIIVSMVAVAGIAASLAIFVQIIRQGRWKLAEPSVIKGRWQMVRPWLLVGAVLGLLLGIAFVLLNGSDQSPPAAPKDVIVVPLPEVKSQPREVPVVNDADQTSTVSSETVSAVPDSVGQVIAKSAFDDHEGIQGTWDYVTLTTGPRDSIVFAQDTITFHVRDQTVAGTFVLDGSTQPKSIDLLFAGEPGGADSRQGIYQFQQDLLVICLGTTPGFRPTEFQKGEKQNHILLVRPTP